jgi:hypothetical protein
MPKPWFLGAALLVSVGCGEKASSGAGASSGAPSVAGSGASAGAPSGSGGAGSESLNGGAGNAGSSASSAGAATGGMSGTSGTSGTSGAAGVAASCPPSDGLKVERVTATSIAELGKPFDTDGDKTSPWGWDSNYGKPPEIVALPDGEALDILWQDHAADVASNQPDPNKNAKLAFVVRVEKSAGGYAVTRAYRIEQLAHIMGFAKDEQGNYYVASGVDEDADLTAEDPAPGMHRPNIVKLVKFDEQGCKSLEIDAGLARQKADAKSEPIINPMVAATSRLAYAAGRLAIVHGINVDYDPKVMARHQKAQSTHFDSLTGAATLTSSMWVSHSFDQRVFWDGSGFVELHLGDAYPRSIALGRFNDQKSGSKTYELFKPKGDEGDNNTFTRLGGIAPITQGDWGYLVVFTTERGAETAELLNGTRDLAFLRVSRGFAGMSEAGNAFVDGETLQEVTSSGAAVTNKLSWLTDYAAEAAQADRPRVAAIGDDQYVLLWERWTGSGDRQSSFSGLEGLVLGGDGKVVVQPKQLGAEHLSRGDDVVAWGGRALFVSGSGKAKKLTVNLVDSDLTLSSFELP